MLFLPPPAYFYLPPQVERKPAWVGGPPVAAMTSVYALLTMYTPRNLHDHG